MDKDIKSKLSFINYTVKEVNFIANDEFKGSGEPINIDFDIEHNTDIKDNKMNIELTLNVFKDMKVKNYPFYMKIRILGEFMVVGDNIEIFEINGIAILYPYIRSIVSTYTANSNIPTLILPPINVSEYYKKRKDISKKN